MDIEITTEDGVKLREGDAAYNYYDMKPGYIVPNSITFAPDAWFRFQHPDGTDALLNGPRICSVEFAKQRGFKDA